MSQSHFRHNSESFRFTKFCILALSVLLTAHLSSCTKKKTGIESSDNPPTSQTEVKPVAPSGEGQAPKDAVSCPSGKTAKVYEGNCSGTWTTVKNAQGQTACVFNWGPPVECKAGATAVGIKTFCYGALEKPGSGGGTPGECSSAYGTPPQVAPYKLTCCE
ncbi:MAG TPA: hypothetical protein PLZ57_14190 [Pseudobdellovibrionaceae bacterium]|nr:hypothetical protein [Pseudobdellovibrionaceae bacterium]